MARRRLLWQLFPSYLLITLAAMLAVGVYATSVLRRFHTAELFASLRSRCMLVAPRAKELVTGGSEEAVDELAKALGEDAGVRITVILPSGRVIGDTESNPATMDNHAARPEVARALDGATGSSIRYSQTLKTDLMYVAVPLESDGTVIGVVRMALPVSEIQSALGSFYAELVLAGLIVAAAAALVSLAVSRRISRPLSEIKQGASRFARGDLDHKLRLGKSAELAALAETLNEMAGQLARRIETVERQRRELEAVLSSMVEGVMAVDADENILSLNRAAAGLLGLDPEQAAGHSLLETVRDPQLHSLVAQALSAGEPVEGQLVIEDASGKHFLQAHVTTLRDACGNAIGALVVLNDVTRLRRLEMVRRDFVANVSHEIRTPITSIKGFVETLREGALEDREAARRFLGIIERQADRLAAIVNDLLTLARLE